VLGYLLRSLQVVIERMRLKEAARRPLLKWEIVDMLSLDGIEDGTYDAVVDKVKYRHPCTGGGPPEPVFSMLLSRCLSYSLVFFASLSLSCPFCAVV
jgi:hypothetical protein